MTFDIKIIDTKNISKAQQLTKIYKEGGKQHIN